MIETQLSHARHALGLVMRLSRDKRSTVSVQLTQQPIGLIESAHRIGGTTRIRMFFKRPLLVSLPNGAESDRSSCLG